MKAAVISSALMTAGANVLVLTLSITRAPEEHHPNTSEMLLSTDVPQQLGQAD